jgi:hypothetical protein
MTTPKLSERERRFVEAFMGKAAGNATKAAIAAGYSVKSARRSGTRLSTKRHIREAIAARQKDDPAVADREERQRFLTSMMRDIEGHPLARLKACDQLSKIGGDYIERHEHAGKDGGPLVVKFGGRYRETDA